MLVQVGAQIHRVRHSAEQQKRSSPAIVATHSRSVIAYRVAAREDPVSAWTGRALVVWGGRAPIGGRPFADGATFTPSTP